VISVVSPPPFFQGMRRCWPARRIFMAVAARASSAQ
jgi:hypothetical protein